MSDLVVAGLNHRTAGVGLREQAAIPARELSSTLPQLQDGAGLQEVVVLSTCNRVEIYGVAPAAEPAQERLTHWLHGRIRAARHGASTGLYHLRNDEAVSHVFRVAAGLDSLVLGESEIAGQVKLAYQAAQACGTAGPVLNRLFQKTLHAAKEMRARTSIGRGQASIGSVVVELVGVQCGRPLAGTQVLLWGAGKAAETTARHLAKNGARTTVVNRTAAKAQDLAAICRGGWMSWEQATAHLAHVDVAIVCTEAPHYVIDANDLSDLLPSRSRPLILIDLAVPRNVDPAVTRLPGVRLFNVDDLQAMARAGVNERAHALHDCERIVRQQTANFLEWWNTTNHKGEAEPCPAVSVCS